MTELAVLPVHGISIHYANYSLYHAWRLKLKKFGIDINPNTHKKSKSDYEKNNN